MVYFRIGAGCFSDGPNLDVPSRRTSFGGEPNQGRTTMPELTAIEVESLSNRKCQACDVTMRLFGIEAHPTIDRMDLRTYVCPRCDAVGTEIVPASMELNFPVRALLAGGGLDADGHHLHPDGARLRLSGGCARLVQPPRAVVGRLDHHG